MKKKTKKKRGARRGVSRLNTTPHAALRPRERPGAERATLWRTLVCAFDPLYLRTNKSSLACVGALVFCEREKVVGAAQDGHVDLTYDRYS